MNICRHDPVLKKSSRSTDIWLRLSPRPCCKNYSVRVNQAPLDHKLSQCDIKFGIQLCKTRF